MSESALSEVVRFLEDKKSAIEYPLDLRELLGEHGVLGVFIPGGYGPTAQFDSNEVIRLFLHECLSSSIPIAAVCHGVSALLTVDVDAFPLEGRRVTSFSNAEERSSGADGWVPYFLESKLAERGLEYVCDKPWSCHVIEDSGLVTGQNPASSEEAACRLTRCIEQRELV